MEFLGVGASELIFILIIAIIVLGPKDMQKAGRTIGRWLNQIVRSEGWKALQRASQEVRRLPTHLMREANLDAQDLQDLNREIRGTIDPRQLPGAPGRYPPPQTKPTPPPASSPAPRNELDPDTDQHE